MDLQVFFVVVPLCSLTWSCRPKGTAALKWGMDWQSCLFMPSYVMTLWRRIFGIHINVCLWWSFRNIGVEEKVKEPEIEEESWPAEKTKEEHTAGKSKGKEKVKAGADKQGDRRKSAGKRTAMGRRNSTQPMSPPPGASTPASDVDGQR